jgi:5-hydroxyisourate hydrolase-like protein (transthyretin family)
LNKKIQINEQGGKISFVLDQLALNAGDYTMNFLIAKNGIDQDLLEGVYNFHVGNGDYYDSKNFYPESYEGFYQGFDII